MITFEELNFRATKSLIRGLERIYIPIEVDIRKRSVNYIFIDFDANLDGFVLGNTVGITKYMNPIIKKQEMIL